MIRAILIGVLSASFVACSREADPVPPTPPVTAAAEEIDPEAESAEEPGLVTRAYRFREVPRSKSNLTCWLCFYRARDAARATPGVVEVRVHPDSELVIVEYDAGELTDLERLLKALERALAASAEEVDVPDDVSRRVRMTREIPPRLRPSFERAEAEDFPLIVIRCTANACDRCEVPDVPWDDDVVYVEVDVDSAVDMRGWLAPEAVPEWICFDRRGREMGRWRGRVDPATRDAKLDRFRAVVR